MKKFGIIFEILLVAAAIFLAFRLGSSIVSTIVFFVLILGLLVFVHELGHFVMAKRAGMKVEEFGFGFPPRMFGFTRGETVYSVNWIPLGGFVKIMGEDGAESDDSRNFVNKNFFQRFSVLIAGVSMNFILAWLLISIGLAVGLPTVVGQDQALPKSARIRDVSVAITDIAQNGPAAQNGVKAGDQVLRINGQEVTSIQQVQESTKQNLEKNTVYTFKRGGELLDKTLVPRANPPEGEGPLGVALSSIGKVSYPWHEALVRGLGLSFRMLWAIVVAFVTIIGQWVTGHSVSEALSGPIGIAVLTRDVAELGLIYLLQFTAILSINLAVINAIPFPALDGGRILFLIIEKLRGKKIPVKAEQVANTVGFALLLLLMVVITVRDVGKFAIIDKFKNLF